MAKQGQLIGALLIVAGIALGIAAQFVPSGEEDQIGNDCKVYPWGAEACGTFGDKSESWFDTLDEDDDGAGLLKAQMVLFYIGLGVALLGILAGLSNGTAGIGTTAAAFVIIGLSLTLFVMGLDQHYGSSMELATGFWLSVSACGAFLVGAVLQKF